MNISKQTLEQLDLMYSYFLTDDYSRELDNEPNKANRLYIGFEKQNNEYNGNYIGKCIATPSKMEVTIEWILNKLNTEVIYKNFSETFKKLIKMHSIDVYPTSYGIGVFVLFNFRNESTIICNTVKNKLDQLGIIYTNEYSEAGWVFRFKISKSKENIERINEICK